jgi:hypothetical protein
MVRTIFDKSGWTVRALGNRVSKSRMAAHVGRTLIRAIGWPRRRCFG